MSETHDKTIVCRCEEITVEDIRSCIAKGFDSFDEIKRVLRVSMGPCQGRGCKDIILREISAAKKMPIADLDPGTVRPPVKPIKIGVLAYGEEAGK